MPSILTLEGPGLGARALVNSTFPSRILSPSPGLQGFEFSATAANFWLGIGLGVAGTILVGRIQRGEPLFKKKSSADVAGASLGRCGRRNRRSRR